MEFGVEIVEGLLNGSVGHEAFEFVVGDFEVEFFLELHSKFDYVERVGSEIVSEFSFGRDVFDVYAQVLGDDPPRFFFDSGHWFPFRFERRPRDRLLPHLPLGTNKTPSRAV